jgi:hypothetical protein
MIKRMEVNFDIVDEYRKAKVSGRSLGLHSSKEVG